VLHEIEEFKKFDSIFLGAIGHPDVKPGILEVGILLKTRFALDQYMNTGGIYTGVGGVTQKGTPLELATQVMQYSRPVVGPRGEPPSSARRVPSREGMETLPGFPSWHRVKYAYECTRRRNSKKKMLTLVHKPGQYGAVALLVVGVLILLCVSARSSAAA
jgi:3-isopropylmalate dehydrogenase